MMQRTESGTTLLSTRFSIVWRTLLVVTALPFLLPVSQARAQGTLTPSSQSSGEQQPSGSTPANGQTHPKEGQTTPEETLPDATKLPTYDEGTPIQTGNPISTASEGNSLRAWRGLRIDSIDYVGVPARRLTPLQAQLPIQAGQPLDPRKVRETLRRLYATGLYTNIDVEGIRSGDSVRLFFSGKARYFIGRVNIDGVSDETFTSLLLGTSRLSPGTPYTQAKLDRGKQLIEQNLQNNGYYQGQVYEAHEADPGTQQMNVTYVVTLGNRAKVGDVKTDGETGLTEKKFQKVAKLKPNAKVTRDTVNTAISKLRASFQKKERLEAKVTLTDKQYQELTNHLNYSFNVVQGPLVQVTVNGAKLSKGRIKDLVPVYQEGAVDEDLLNEGNRRIRDFFQRKGYFNVEVSHTLQRAASGSTLITFNVNTGKLHDVDSVTISGNRYFDSDLILPRLNVHAASFFDRRGLYSQALVASDVSTITAIYEGNGFSNVSVDPVIQDVETDKHGAPSKASHIRVNYKITEGTQQRFGSFNLVGNIQVPTPMLKSLLNTQAGQPYSSPSITGDRDAVLTYYLGHGYDHAKAELKQVPNPQDPNLIDVTLQITEGDQVHINQVLISGLHYTRNKTVDPHILVHAGDVLNQTALLETQRQLYDLTLFNGVNAAVQNPNGDELKKNVMLQFTEAKRWDVNYIIGFQVQTGNPGSCNAADRIRQGLSPYGFCGSFGASALIGANVSRNNLRGTDQSISLKSLYGSLEKEAVLTYSFPHPFNNRNLMFSVSGGYTNLRDVTTYAASRLEGTARLSQRQGKATTWIYQYAFRRVSVDADTVQVSPIEIPLLSQPATVGGPGVTWIRDTRRPSSLDATGGTYNTVQEFISNTRFGSSANFNRLDFTNSSYYPFGSQRRFVFARDTRIGFERAYGDGPEELIPLPERLYGGGAESHRGFGINAAGPRDSVTGFPIGGAGAFINSFELRLPPPILPYVGNSVSFVLFHDMGNVFVKGSDIWPSFLRFRQPNRAGCRDLSLVDQEAPADEQNSIEFNGRCSYNYFSHALGVGARYGTPIGPIRVDFSYNLNPPIFPEINGYDLANPDAPAKVGEAGHFNFFFSIGQAF